MNTASPKEGKKNLVDEALDELVCPLCMGTFVQPLSLSCLHSYCETCLVSLVRAKNSGWIDCPECRAVTPLSAGGVKGNKLRNGYNTTLKPHPATPTSWPDHFESGGATPEHGISNTDKQLLRHDNNLMNVTGEGYLDNNGHREHNQLSDLHFAQDLPINFKLKRFVEILSAEERQRLVGRGSCRIMNRNNTSSSTNPDLMCPVHKDKLLEYYCAPCKAVICGQCMIDEHRIHGEVRYVSEILDSHVVELRNLLPELKKVTTEGEATVRGVKDNSKKLETVLEAETSRVHSYFSSIRDILKEKEEDIVSEMKSTAKKKEKLSQKHVSRLSNALEEVEKCRQIVEDTVERKAKDPSLLQAEPHIRARVYASMRQVEEQVLDSKASQDVFCSLTSFSPDPSVESDCRGLHYISSSPIQTRLYSTSLGEDEKRTSHIPSRSRSDAILPPITISGHRPFSTFSTSNRDTSAFSNLAGRTSTVSCSKKRTSNVNLKRPASEISRKNLIGPYNNVTAYPHGVCCLPEGTLLVTDCRHHLFRIVTSTGKCLETIGSEGRGDGQFCEPAAITTDADGSILVADGKGTGRIQKFSTAGMLLSKFKVRGLTSGVYMSEPAGIAVTDAGEVLVTDAVKSCVHIFDKSGKYQGKFGNFTDLKQPTGIAASKTRVVLTDRALHCVFILTQHGQILSKVSQHGTSPGDLLLPYGIAINKDGYIFVSESGNHRISVFTPGGKFERCFGSKGSEGGKFDTPRHVCFNHLGQLVVCDEQNQRVQLFNVDSK